MFIFIITTSDNFFRIDMALDDSKLISDVVDRLKKQGLFDKFRKECMADVDTKVRLVWRKWFSGWDKNNRDT